MAFEDTQPYDSQELFEDFDSLADLAEVTAQAPPPAQTEQTESQTTHNPYSQAAKKRKTEQSASRFAKSFSRIYKQTCRDIDEANQAKAQKEQARQAAFDRNMAELSLTFAGQIAGLAKSQADAASSSSAAWQPSGMVRHYSQKQADAE